MSMPSRIVTIAGLTVAVALLALAGWSAIGPDLVKTCPAPALRPGGPGWTLTATEIGGLNGPGDVWGSTETWRRAAAADMPEQRLTLVRAKALDGEWGRPTSVRGRSARIVSSEWPEPGSVAVWWDEGGLGCTIHGLVLTGDAVTEAEVLAAVEALR